MFYWQLLNAAESPIMEFFVAFRSPILNTIALGYTELGHAAFGAALFLVFWAFEEKNFASRIFLGLLGSNLLTVSLKTFFRRFIPYKFALDAAPKFLLPYGFPSGHTMSAFVLAHLLGSKFGKKPVFYTLAGLVGISRVYLGVHYLSDVIVGGFLGVLVGKLAMSRHSTLFLEKVSRGKDFIYSKLKLS